MSMALPPGVSLIPSSCRILLFPGGGFDSEHFSNASRRGLGLQRTPAAITKASSKSDGATPQLSSTSETKPGGSVSAAQSALEKAKAYAAARRRQQGSGSSNPGQTGGKQQDEQEKAVAEAGTTQATDLGIPETASSQGGLSQPGRVRSEPVAQQQAPLRRDQQPQAADGSLAAQLKLPRTSEGSILGGAKEETDKGTEAADAKSIIGRIQPETAYAKQQQDMLTAISQSRQLQNEVSKEPSASRAAAKDIVEVEIVTRDGIVRKQLSRSEMAWWDERSQTRSKASSGTTRSQGNESKTTPSTSSTTGPSTRTRPNPELKLSSSDFVGLGFSDEPRGGAGSVPAGLYAPADAPPPGQLPQVEIITRDASTLAAPPGSLEQAEDVYKPKVATWGVFPRPRDISQAYGGGRTIRPGEALETEEEKQQREGKTRRMLEEYSKLVGLSIDPQVKNECQQALELGTNLMDLGKLTEAVSHFDSVIARVPFKNDLHGKAALQKAMCLDSLARRGQAKDLYERLGAHPNMGVKKKAQQMLFGFRAEENLKIAGTSSWKAEWYRQYFDQISRNSQYNNVYKAESEENDTLVKDALTYGALILMPLFLMLVVVVHKHGP